MNSVCGEFVHTMIIDRVGLQRDFKQISRERY